MSDDDYKDPFLADDDGKKADDDLVEDVVDDAVDEEEDDEDADLLWDADEEA